MLNLIRLSTNPIKNSAIKLITSIVVITFSQSVLAAKCIPPTADGAGLQSCLDSSAAGDTIVLQPGTYVPTSPQFFPAPEGNTFLISKQLTIKGKGPGVILSGDIGGGNNAFNVIAIDATASPGQVTLENLSIENGNSVDGGFYVGGGIVTGPNQSVILNKVKVQNNSATLAGGIFPGEDSDWVINGSNFLNNTAIETGGAIMAGGIGSLEINGGRFEGNRAHGLAGGALHFNSFGSLFIEGAKFNNNSSGESGGAITIQGVEVGQTYSINNSEFHSNRTLDAEGFGGAIDIFSIVNEGSITNSTFQYNSAELGGGAVYITQGRATLSNNHFTYNRSYLGGAAGIQGDDEDGPRSTMVTFEKNTLENNTGGEGGALLAFDIWSSNTSSNGLVLYKNKYRNNHATENGGAVLISGGVNITVEKDHYDSNWADIAIGGLGVLNIRSGELTKLHFNQNGANTVPDSLYIEASPELLLNVNGLKFANETENDCVINFVIVECP